MRGQSNRQEWPLPSSTVRVPAVRQLPGLCAPFTVLRPGWEVGGSSQLRAGGAAPNPETPGPGSGTPALSSPASHRGRLRPEPAAGQGRPWGVPARGWSGPTGQTAASEARGEEWATHSAQCAPPPGGHRTCPLRPETPTVTTWVTAAMGWVSTPVTLPPQPTLLLPQGKRRKNLEATRGKAGTTGASEPGRGGGGSQRAPWSPQPCPLPGVTANSSILPGCQLSSRSYPAGRPNFLNGPDSHRPLKPKHLAVPALRTVHEPQTGD